MFKNSKYDLVLMDENMPELNGIGAMKQIKEYENRTLDGRR
jgi:CheY-like chemotaxis protein